MLEAVINYTGKVASTEPTVVGSIEIPNGVDVRITFEEIEGGYRLIVTNAGQAQAIDLYGFTPDQIEDIQLALAAAIKATETAQGKAETAQGAAESARDRAETAASSASESATAAAKDARNAAASAVLAAQYATSVTSVGNTLIFKQDE